MVGNVSMLSTLLLFIPYCLHGQPNRDFGRLKPLLDNIIYPKEGTFVANRHIRDNIGVVHELIHKERIYFMVF